MMGTTMRMAEQYDDVTRNGAWHAAAAAAAFLASPPPPLCAEDKATRQRSGITRMSELIN